MAVVTFRLPDSLYERLQKALKDSGYETVSEFLRDAIREFVREHEEE